MVASRHNQESLNSVDLFQKHTDGSAFVSSVTVNVFEMVKTFGNACAFLLVPSSKQSGHYCVLGGDLRRQLACYLCQC
jgi:hypothetical protein